MANETRPSYFGQAPLQNKKSDYPILPSSMYELYNPFVYSQTQKDLLKKNQAFIKNKSSVVPPPVAPVAEPPVKDTSNFKDVDTRYYDTKSSAGAAVNTTKTKTKKTIAPGTDLFSPSELKAFQSSVGIVPDGISGPKTKAYAKQNGIPLTQAEYNAATGQQQTGLPVLGQNSSGPNLTGGVFPDSHNGTIISRQSDIVRPTYNYDYANYNASSTSPSALANAYSVPGQNSSMSRDDAMASYLGLFEPKGKPFSGYGDAWNSGEGTLGGISNMWDQFTAEGGSQMNPTASAMEKMFGGLGNAASIYSGIMDAKYKKDLSNLANRQQAFQEAQANKVNQLQDKAQKSYDDSFQMRGL